MFLPKEAFSPSVVFYFFMFFVFSGVMRGNLFLPLIVWIPDKYIQGQAKNGSKVAGVTKKRKVDVYKKGREILLPDLSYFTEKEERKDIKLPLDILSPRQKEVIYLLYYDCLSEAERQLGLSRSTIRTHKKSAE